MLWVNRWRKMWQGFPHDGEYLLRLSDGKTVQVTVTRLGGGKFHISDGSINMAAVTGWKRARAP